LLLFNIILNVKVPCWCLYWQ